MHPTQGASNTKGLKTETAGKKVVETSGLYEH